MQGNVQGVEQPRPGHAGLARRAFLGRSTIDPDLSLHPGRLRPARQPDRRPDAGRTEQVMAAGMAELPSRDRVGKGPGGLRKAGRSAHYEPSNADPHLGAAKPALRIAQGCLDTLVRKTDRGDVLRGLATGWALSEDQCTYTFDLRKDVTSHDRTPFDAQAVKA
ncbi:MAG: hypothetical protein CML68_11260 [Rhodobacteraceae bacterium]|nr:hypothetical protein [Paracoccaceae bacterium]